MERGRVIAACVALGLVATTAVAQSGWQLSAGAACQPVITSDPGEVSAAVAGCITATEATEVNLGLCLGVACGGQPPPAGGLPAGAFVLYQLWDGPGGDDQDLPDTSGNSRDGIRGPTTGVDDDEPTWVTDVGLRFPAAGDVGDRQGRLHADVETVEGELTVAFLIKPTDLSHDINLVSAFKGSASFDGWGVRYLTATNRLGAYNGLTWSQSAGADLTVDAWQVVVVSWRSNEVFFSVNGAAVDDSSHTNPNTPILATPRFGQSPTGFSTSIFEGDWGLTAIWDSGLPGPDETAIFDFIKSNAPAAIVADLP